MPFSDLSQRMKKIHSDPLEIIPIFLSHKRKSCLLQKQNNEQSKTIMIFSKNLVAFLPLAMATAATLLPFTLAEVFEYRVDPWGIPDAWSEGYPTLDAKAGDTVSFHWVSGYNSGDDYNVYLYPTESCADEDGKEWIGSSSGAWYKIDEWDQGKTLHFACDTADYCERGMSIVINVAPAPADPWKQPETPSPTKAPTYAPTYAPTKAPTKWPTPWPTDAATKAPTHWPTYAPTYAPPTYAPTYKPVTNPTDKPIINPTDAPTEDVVNDIIAEEPPPAQSFDLQWVIPDTPYNPISVNVGDTLTFNMGPGHNVFIHPSQSCDKTDAIFIGDSAATSYTFIDKDGSPEGNQMFFACDVGTHCDLGMQIVVTVFSQEPSANDEEEPEPESQEPVDEDLPEPEPVQDNVPQEGPETVSLEWLIPEDQLPYDPLSVNVGDTIAFNMGPGHNVFIHPSLSCDPAGALFIGDEAETTYTFQPEDGSPAGKPMFFACDIGPHCDLGMQIAVNVFSTETPSSNDITSGGSTSTIGAGAFDAVVSENSSSSTSSWPIASTITTIASALVASILIM
jgi:plastocyanin